VYLVAIAGVLHFWWLVKIDYTRPLVYSAVIGTLFAVRIASRFRPKAAVPPAVRLRQSETD
jgi:sulfoxide reductase heme-binding subunit YedZ